MIVMVMVIGEEGEGSRVEGQVSVLYWGLFLKCRSLAAACLALIYTPCPCHLSFSLLLSGSPEKTPVRVLRTEYEC